MGRRQIQLLRHYPTDGQESMRRYGDFLATAFREADLDVTEWTPKVRAGALHRSARGLGKYLGYIDKYLLFQRQLRQLPAQTSSVVAIPDHSHGMYVPLVAPRPHVVHVHDLMAIRSALGEVPENQTGFAGRLYQRKIAQGLAQTKHVVCVSEQTAREFRRLFPESRADLRVVYNGLNFSYFPAPQKDVLQRYDRPVGTPFLLHVGGNQWYKNRLGVLQVYAALRATRRCPHHLVLIGKEPPEALRKLVQEEGLGDTVHFLTGVTNEDLRAFYSLADAFLFPSRHEGFGWPIAEAHACGTTVFTTGAPPMTEVGGDAAEYLPVVPSENAAMSSWATVCAESIARVLTESTEHRETRRERNLANARRFAPAPLQREIVRLYEEVAAWIPEGVTP